jgi:hypothetical protein
LLCFALLCFALLCFALLCFALLCFALLCFALLCWLVCPLGLLRIGSLADVVYLCAGFGFGKYWLLLCFALVGVSTWFASHWVTH